MQPLKPTSPFNMTQYLTSKGYDIFPYKENKKYKISLWRHDAFIDYGKFEYDSAEEAVSITTENIYNAIKTLD